MDPTPERGEGMPPLRRVPDRPGGGAESDATEHGDQSARLAQLLTRSARGHEDAFAELYDLTIARVFGVVLRVLRAPDLAAEVTQEVYLEIWKHAARYSVAKGSVAAWMNTVAHRRAVDRVRSESSDTARDTKYAKLTAPPATDHVWEGVAQTLDVERVRKAMGSLTEIQREAITLSYFGGYTQSQVAALLKLPLGTVKTRIRDGLIGLRDALGVES